MNINLTMLGQAISFFIFVVFCMKYVWPPLTTIMRERQQAIREGLEKAAEAETQLEQANTAAAEELESAKSQAAELINQAHNRAGQIVEEAKQQATEEATRIKEGAQAEIDQEVSRAREALRARVGELAVAGAEKILQEQVNPAKHAAMLNELSEQL